MSGWRCSSTPAPSPSRPLLRAAAATRPASTRPQREQRPLPWADFREGLGLRAPYPVAARQPARAGSSISFAVSGSFTMLPLLVTSGYGAPSESFGYLLAVGGGRQRRSPHSWSACCARVGARSRRRTSCTSSVSPPWSGSGWRRTSGSGGAVRRADVRGRDRGQHLAGHASWAHGSRGTCVVG